MISPTSDEEIEFRTKPEQPKFGANLLAAKPEQIKYIQSRTRQSLFETSSKLVEAFPKQSEVLRSLFEATATGTKQIKAITLVEGHSNQNKANLNPFLCHESDLTGPPIRSEIEEI